MALPKGCAPLLVEREAPGGQAGTVPRIENYLRLPGRTERRRPRPPGGRAGAAVRRRNPRPAWRRFGSTPQTAITASRSANGSDHRRARPCWWQPASPTACSTSPVPTAWREPAFLRAAITEALGVQDQDVFVVGGGNSAGQAALYLGRYARRVTSWSAAARSPTACRNT